MPHHAKLFREKISYLAPEKVSYITFSQEKGKINECWPFAFAQFAFSILIQNTLSREYSHSQFSDTFHTN